MENEVATNLDAADATNAIEAEGVEDTGTVEADDQQFDAEGNPIEDDAGADEEEEIELDENLKLKVPKEAAQKLKELKEGNLRQADYTRKTQEVAELRKAADAALQAVNQATTEEIAARARIVAMDEQIAEFNKVDWDAWEAQDPFAAASGARRFQQLQIQRGSAAQTLSELSHKRTLETQQVTAKRIEEGRAVLSKEIPGWNDGKAAEVLDGGTREYGFKRSEIEEFEDPRMVIALNDALQWRAHLAKQKKTQSIAKGQKVEPAKTLKGTSGSIPVRADTNDFAAFEKLADRKLKV